MTATGPGGHPSGAAHRPGPVARLLLVVVSAYRRWVSPALPPRCRFYPSCSAYAVEALREHGAVRGGALTLWRLSRCHPFHPGGHDPVPPVRTTRTRPRPTTAPGASR